MSVFWACLYSYGHQESPGSTAIPTNAEHRESTSSNESSSSTHPGSPVLLLLFRLRVIWNGDEHVSVVRRQGRCRAGSGGSWSGRHGLGTVDRVGEMVGGGTIVTRSVSSCAERGRQGQVARRPIPVQSSTPPEPPQKPAQVRLLARSIALEWSRVQFITISLNRSPPRHRLPLLVGLDAEGLVDVDDRGVVVASLA